MIDLVRQHVQTILRQHGAAPAEECRETVLVRDGYYCGRRFEIDGMTAVWFVEEQQIKCFDRRGALLDVSEVADLQRRAA